MQRRMLIRLSAEQMPRFTQTVGHNVSIRKETRVPGLGMSCTWERREEHGQEAEEDIG
jgi:hypothetical protein